jgi:MSHA pilin protein MshD
MCINRLCSVKASLAQTGRMWRKISLQSGISLIELIVFIIIVSTSIVGILSVMNVTVKSSADPMVRKQAIAMAEAIMDEVLAKDYAPNSGFAGPDVSPCPNRPLYDDVDDYNCFSGGAAVITGTNTLGATAISTLANYKATVTVATVTVGGIAMKKITVTVTDGAQTIQLFGYRGSY